MRANQQPEQRSLRTVRTLVVLDPMTGLDRTQEDELRQILQTYENDHDLRLEAALKDVFDPTDTRTAAKAPTPTGSSRGNCQASRIYFKN